MQIHDKIIKYYLRNTLFLNGTAYAGKSTAAAMLAERYDLILCGENYHSEVAELVAEPEDFPNIGYFQTKKSWQEFLNRAPEDYVRWIDGTSREAEAFEIARLLNLSGERRVIVDTNLSLKTLQKIADYRQVAIMLSPQSLSVDRFFEREDPEKQFLLRKIGEAEDPEKTMKNFRACLAAVNSRERYEAFAQSGFFTLVREESEKDTRDEVLLSLAEHFGLEVRG